MFGRVYLAVGQSLAVCVFRVLRISTMERLAVSERDRPIVLISKLHLHPGPPESCLSLLNANAGSVSGRSRCNRTVGGVGVRDVKLYAAMIKITINEK